MEILLIRHAHAGHRQSGSRDRYRALTQEGLDQAQSIADALAERAVSSVLASPASRCIQTVEPLAQSKEIEVQENEIFWEGSSIDDVMAFLDQLVAASTQRTEPTGEDSPSVVICSHGDIIPEVVERLAHAGVAIHGRGCERASTWVLHHDGDDWTSARYFSRKDWVTL